MDIEDGHLVLRERDLLPEHRADPPRPLRPEHFTRDARVAAWYAAGAGQCYTVTYVGRSRSEVVTYSFRGDDPASIVDPQARRDAADARHPFVAGRFAAGSRGGQWPSETCDVCGRDPRNEVHRAPSSEPKAFRESWVSLHAADGSELTYPRYERQRVFELDGVWRHGGGPLRESPVSFPMTTTRVDVVAVAFGVSLTRDGEPVFSSELHPHIDLDSDRSGGVTPQVVCGPALYEVLRRVRFPAR